MKDSKGHRSHQVSYCTIGDFERSFLDVFGGDLSLNKMLIRCSDLSAKSVGEKQN